MISAMDPINEMLHSLQSEPANSEDALAQLQEIQESFRLASLNCLLDFVGHLELIGSELTHNKSDIGSLHFQNGYSHEAEESADPLPGSIVDPHQKLLMVLSNIGYCKDELAQELYENTKIFGFNPGVKGVRDAAVDLLHTFVAVHAEVFSGCKPLLDKVLGILVEGLIDILLGLFNENNTTNLRTLDPSGFTQLMLEVKYFETILNPYFTNDAMDSLKSLQGVLLEKAIETITKTVETPNHQRRPTRGSDDALAEDWRSASSASPDDLIFRQESTQLALWSHFHWTQCRNQLKQHMLLLEGRWILPA